MRTPADEGMMASSCEDSRIQHTGLEELVSLDLYRLVRRMGEQKTIDLIGKLISGKACEDQNFIDKVFTDLS